MKFDAFGTSKHGEGKSLSNFFFALLIGTLGRINRENEKKRQRRLKMNLCVNLYFTYKSRDTRKSLTLFITVKTIAKLNLGHRNKFEIEY